MTNVNIDQHRDAEFLSHQTIHELISSQRVHIGTIDPAGSFVAASRVPSTGGRADHGLVAFDATRLLSPNVMIADVLAYLNTTFGPGATDLLGSSPRGGLPAGHAVDSLDSRERRVAGPLWEDGPTGYALYDHLGWRVVDLTPILPAPGSRTPVDNIVWKTVEHFRLPTGRLTVRPVTAMIPCPFEDFAPYGRAYPATDGPGPSPHPDAGGRATVLVLDTGLVTEVPLGGTVGFSDTSPAGDDRDDVEGPGGPGWLRTIAGHGTFVAGIARHLAPAAEIRVADVSQQDPPRNTYLVFEDQLGADLVFGLGHASTDDVIVNMSISGSVVDDPQLTLLQQVIAWTKAGAAPPPGYASTVVKSGDHVVYVGATGDIPGGSTSNYLPAGLPDVVSVGALDPAGEPALFSCEAGVQLWAAGEDVVGAYPVGQVAAPPVTVPGWTTLGTITHTGSPPWVTWSGTSFAAPVVSAAIARLVSTAVSAQAALDAVLATPPGPSGRIVIT